MLSANTSHKFDPITVEIIQSSLVAVAEEMFVSMAKAAMSSVIYEVLDFGVAVTDRDGNLASAGAGIPTFVGMLEPAVKAVIKKFGTGKGVSKGDIFITNDPYSGGVSHINDVSLVMPVFADDVLVAWVANKGHWVDVGGMVPGGQSPHATEVFQEGLIFPEVKLFDRGQPIQSVIDIIMSNNRLPEQTAGDMWAGVSALRIGANRIEEIAAKYTIEVLLYSIENYLSYGESVARNALKALPKGTFTASDLTNDNAEIKVVVTITEDAFIVDLRGNPPQDKGPMNTSYMATLVTIQAIYKGIVAPQKWANAGSYRPLQLLTDKGSMFDAEFPAPVGFWYENKLGAYDLVWKALAPHLSGAVPAGNFNGVCATAIGFKRDNGKSHSFIEPQIGGWGASINKDGENALFSGSHGDTYNCPVEVHEIRNGVQIDCLKLSDEPSGAGKYRGGKGIELRYRILGQDGWVTTNYSRATVPPWGMEAGFEGTTNKVKIFREGKCVSETAKLSKFPVLKNDVICIQTGNGGGFGSPLDRDRELVRQDLKDGFITEAEARNVYGLVDH
ncbi:hydantoinase B/oxoprolinase family protein [Kordiimonas lipolytica]|uniref:Hydantoinase B/oxoprolinase family protein n=1 Tax=Kordiimonas lipolytica TaxID=1662421 RepID=A0ABV8UGF0_9PROT|nr:hydantoinase B/oxoprolinase family protein [Kordiimonas lipolytica]